MKFPLLVMTLRLTILVGAIAACELLVQTRILNSFILPAPSRVVMAIASWFATGVIWEAVASTMFVLAVGWGIGMVGGVVIGMLMARVPFFRHYFDVFIVFLNSVPRLVLIPFLVVIFGFGQLPGIIITVSVVIFVVILNTRVAVQDIQGDLIAHAQILGAGQLQLLGSVYLPGVALSVLSSARLTVGIAFTTAIVAQIFGSDGLGFLISQGQETFNTVQIWAAIVVTSALAFVIDLILARVSQSAGRWLPSA